MWPHCIETNCYLQHNYVIVVYKQLSILLHLKLKEIQSNIYYCQFIIVPYCCGLEHGIHETYIHTGAKNAHNSYERYHLCTYTLFPSVQLNIAWKQIHTMPETENTLGPDSI